MELYQDFKELLELFNAHRVEYLIIGVPTHYLGRREFVANKRAAGRLKDLADLERLDEK